GPGSRSRRSRSAGDPAGAAFARRTRPRGRHGLRRRARDGPRQARRALSRPDRERVPVSLHQLRGRGLSRAGPAARAARPRL
ncbi:MAG: hypothetical protein AVDCRST_MAG45-712, partial [uncultured Solirubrobacterales bacterium]